MARTDSASSHDASNRRALWREHARRAGFERRPATSPRRYDAATAKAGGGGGGDSDDCGWKQFFRLRLNFSRADEDVRTPAGLAHALAAAEGSWRPTVSAASARTVSALSQVSLLLPLTDCNPYRFHSIPFRCMTWRCMTWRRGMVAGEPVDVAHPPLRRRTFIRLLFPGAAAPPRAVDVRLLLIVRSAKGRLELALGRGCGTRRSSTTRAGRTTEQHRGTACAAGAQKLPSYPENGRPAGAKLAGVRVDVRVDVRGGASSRSMRCSSLVLQFHVRVCSTCSFYLDNKALPPPKATNAERGVVRVIPVLCGCVAAVLVY